MVKTIANALMSWMLSSDLVPNGYTVQPHPAATGGVNYLVGAWTPGFPPPGVDDEILTTGIWGSDDPLAFVDVTNWGVPPAPVQVQNGGAPEALGNNAPIGGNC